MKIFVLKETNSDARVSASPETTKKLVELGLDVNVQSEAGIGSNFSNDSYTSNGAKIFNNVSDISSADVVIKVNKPN